MSPKATLRRWCGPEESQAEVAWKALDLENTPGQPGQPGLTRGLLPPNPGDKILLKTAMECGESWHLQMTNF